MATSMINIPMVISAMSRRCRLAVDHGGVTSETGCNGRACHAKSVGWDLVDILMDTSYAFSFLGWRSRYRGGGRGIAIVVRQSPTDSWR